MKIEKAEIEIFGQGARSAKYSKIFTAVRALEINTAIKVTLDAPDLNFYSTLLQYFRKTRFPDYKMSVRRKDPTGKEYLIMKVTR